MVRTRRQLDADLPLVIRVSVILDDAPADFAGGRSNHMIFRGIVIRFAAEDIGSERSFLDLIRTSSERFFDDETEKPGVPLAVSEERGRKNALQLVAYRRTFHLGFRVPTTVRNPRRIAVGQTTP